jgi:hypothetical protein
LEIDTLKDLEKALLEKGYSISTSEKIIKWYSKLP